MTQSPKLQEAMAWCEKARQLCKRGGLFAKKDRTDIGKASKKVAKQLAILERLGPADETGHAELADRFAQVARQVRGVVSRGRGAEGNDELITELATQLKALATEIDENIETARLVSKAQKLEGESEAFIEGVKDEGRRAKKEWDDALRDYERVEELLSRPLVPEPEGVDKELEALEKEREKRPAKKSDSGDNLAKRIKDVVTRWKSRKVAEWPDVERVPMKGWLDDLKKAAAAGNQEAEARTLVDRIHRRMDVYESQFLSLNPAFKSLKKRREIAKQAIAAAFPKGTPLETEQKRRFEDMQRILASVEVKRAEAIAAVNAHRFAEAATILEECNKNAQQLMTRARREEFREFTTVELDQGGFARPGREKRLLAGEIGSQGVCQSLVLDFLGAGGSNRDPGDPTQGQITSSHLASQAAYSVEKRLRIERTARLKRELIDLRAREPEGKEKPLDIQIKVLDSEIEIETLEQDVADLERVIADTTEDIRLAEVELKRRGTERAAAVKTLHGVKGVEDVLSTIDLQLAEVQEDVEDSKTLRGLLEKQLTSARRLLASLEANHDALSDDYEAAVATLDEIGKKLVRNQEETRHLVATAVARKKNRVGATATPIPTSVLNKYGIEVKADTASDVQADGKGDALPALRIFGELERRLNEAADDVTTSYNLRAQFMNGTNHALGMKATKRSESGEWDVELFDPNNGAYRFKRLGDFKGFFPKWYGKFHNRGWRAISVCVLDVKGTHASADPQSLLGPTAEVAWNATWTGVEDLRPTVLASPISDATKARVEAAYKKIAAVFPVDDPASATQVDLKIGTTYAERFQQLGAKVLVQAEQWKDKLDGVTGILDGGNDMDVARTLLDEARALHEADKLEGAVAKLVDVEAELKRVNRERNDQRRVSTPELV